MASSRSEDMNSEGGTIARQLSTEVRDRTNSAVGNIQRGQPSSVDIVKSLIKFWDRYFSQMETFGNLMAFLSCFSILIVDPLFFYIKLLNADKKCIAFDEKVGIIGSIVLRSISDFLCLIYVTIPLRTFSPKLTDQLLIPHRKYLRKLVRLSFLYCVLCNLPVQQVLMGLVFARRITGSHINFAIDVIELQMLLRVPCMTVFIISKVLLGSSGGKWAFIILYPYSAYLWGSLWYNLAIDEVSNCWKKACINTGCRIRYCDESLNNYMQNIKTSCNLGLYNDVVNYKLAEEANFPRKLAFCLRWGLQNLSSFGQNLQPNGAVLQNIFAIGISILSVCLFTSYLVYMQGHIQSLQERTEKRKFKIEQIENSKPLKKLSENLQSQVKEGKRHSIWQEITDTKAIDVVNLLSNLSEDLTKEIKRELCLELLKKVEQFGRWSETLLKELCDCVIPISYAQCTYIVQDRESIDEMFFLVQGKLRTYSFRSVNIGSSSTTRCRSITNILKEGEFCGEELVAWFQANPYSCNLPISTKSVKTLTKVDGFALSANDLKIILIKHHKAVFIQAYWRFTMMKKHQTIESQTFAQDQTPLTESRTQLSLEISVEQP